MALEEKAMEASIQRLDKENTTEGRDAKKKLPLRSSAAKCTAKAVVVPSRKKSGRQRKANSKFTNFVQE